MKLRLLAPPFAVGALFTLGIWLFPRFTAPTTSEGTPPQQSTFSQQFSETSSSAHVTRSASSADSSDFQQAEKSHQLLDQLHQASLTPQETALSFYQLTQTDLTEASTFLQNPPAHLTLEQEGLTKVFLEEVVRQKGPEALPLYLTDLLGSLDAEEQVAEAAFHLTNLLTTPGLAKSATELTAPLLTSTNPALQTAAQDVTLEQSLQKQGLIAALTLSQQFGIQATGEDERFNTLLGLAARHRPQELQRWLDTTADDTLRAHYQPFLTGLLKWHQDGLRVK